MIANFLDFELQVRRNCNQPVACIYLGAVEHAQLQESARAHGVLLQPDSEIGRLKYQGIPVFKVDAENHVCIA